MHLANVRIRTVELLTDEDGGVSVAVPKDAAATSISVERSITQRETSWSMHEAGWPSVLTRTPRGRMSGTVVDLDGLAVEDVEVKLGARVDGDNQYLGARSDERGRFSFPHAPDASWIRGSRDGWVQIGATRPGRMEGGQWRDAVLVMTPVGTLDVSVVGPGGEAVTGYPLHVGVRAGEPCTELFGFDVGGRFTSELDGTAWSDGRASLSVPSGIALTCVSDLFTFLGQRDGVAVSSGDSTDADQPIIVPAGGRHQLTIQLAVHRTIRGRTIDAAGQPVRNCHLVVQRMDEVRGTVEPRSALNSNE